MDQKGENLTNLLEQVRGKYFNDIEAPLYTFFHLFYLLLLLLNELLSNLSQILDSKFFYIFF